MNLNKINNLKKIAIIGAGPAGLNALKLCLDAGLNPDIFEKSGLVGGTWNYNEKTGLNDYGVNIPTSTYEGLRTNIPKELMEFENFQHKPQKYSYIHQPDVLNYILDYTETFKLHQHIQFYKHVQNIDVLPNNRWKLTVKNLKPNKQEEEIVIKEYDAVVIAVGNFSYPSYPVFKGINKFQGTVDHSFRYRKSDRYKDRKVLIIGTGPSGQDISRIISKVAKEVIISYRTPLETTIKFSENVKIRNEIEEFQENCVLFKDGTKEIIDDVLFCTGYKREYPFLSKQCEIEVENNYIKYLYKQIINAKHPTMAFLGIPYITYLFTLFGIQMRFFLAYLNGQFTVTQEEMIKDAIDYRNARTDRLSLLSLKKEYYDDLSETAKIKNIPPVYSKLHQYVFNEGKERFDECYRILNDEEFEIIK